MTSAMLRACAFGGCPELTPKKYCAEHERHTDRMRGTAAARGYDAKWSRYSKRFRQTYPFCGMRPLDAPATNDSKCDVNGIVRLANVTDHIVPTTGARDPRFYDRKNHQALCHPCHNAKRQREKRMDTTVGQAPRRPT